METLQARPTPTPWINVSSLFFFASQGSDSEYEVDPNRQKTHSFVNHYISDPTYYNSWRRQQKGISRAQAYSYTESESGDPEHCAPPPLPPLPPLPPQLSSPSPQPQQAQGQPQGQGSLFRPKGSRTPTPSQQSSNPPSQHSTLYRPPSSLAPGSRAPIAGFSSFVWKFWEGHQSSVEISTQPVLKENIATRQQSAQSRHSRLSFLFSSAFIFYASSLVFSLDSCGTRLWECLEHFVLFNVWKCALISLTGWYNTHRFTFIFFAIWTFLHDFHFPPPFVVTFLWSHSNWFCTGHKNLWKQTHINIYIRTYIYI